MLAEAGRLIWENRGDRLFAIGSQGIQYALVASLAARRNDCTDTQEFRPTQAVDRIAIVSGSCSPVTAQSN